MCAGVAVFVSFGTFERQQLMKTTAVLAILALTSCGFSTSHAARVAFDWAAVGDPGNAADSTGYGTVADTYRISKYEVTNAQYTEFLNAVADSDPNGLYNTSMWSHTYGCKIERTGLSGSYSYSVAADRANRPVNYVSFFDAMRFVNWLENGQPTGVQGTSTTEAGVYSIGDGTNEIRNPNASYFIPSEDEWYKTAYYKGGGTNADYWDYPTQSDSVPSNDVTDPDPGNNANFYNQSGDYAIGSPYWMTEVGEFENSESAYGTFDQGGNVWEWNEALVKSSSRVVRGGRWTYYPSDLLSSTRYGVHPAYEDYDVGFRVASIPEPSSLVLGALAAVGLLMCRRVVS